MGKFNFKNTFLKKIQDISGKKLEDLDDIFVVPVGEIAERLGLKIQFVSLDNGSSGWVDKEQKTIYVNDNYSATRNIFTIAHEMGHYLKHKGTQNRYDETRKYSIKELQNEKEANDFAANLLMPKYKFLEVYFEFKGDSRKIANFFGVSKQASDFRALNLGLKDNV